VDAIGVAVTAEPPARESDGGARDPDDGADAVAFDAFVAEVEARVRRALVPVAGPDAARDATTDALVHAWRQWPRVAAMANPAGYVYTVARSRLRRPGAPPTAGPLPEGVADPAAFPQVEPGLSASLAALPERQRTCVYLLHGCGWSTPDVADLLDVSVSTVRNHVARALEHLRRDLGVTPMDQPTADGFATGEGADAELDGPSSPVAPPRPSRSAPSPADVPPTDLPPTATEDGAP
jgi:DNA-directed RNA polymerase specialized sigma24 family protein